MRTIIVDDLKKNDPIFVINKTPGDVVINFVADGKSRSVFIPKTFIPIRATAYTRAINLINSDDFRRVVNIGALVLISAEDAAELMKGDAAKREMERLRKNNSAVFAAAEIDELPLPSPIELGDVSGLDNISIIVRDILARDMHPDGSVFSDEDRRNALEVEYHSGNLTSEDIHHVVSTTQPRTVTHTWASGISREAKNNPELKK